MAIKASADAHAAELRPVVQVLKVEGIESHAAIASALNERGILTPREATWHK